MFDNSALFIVPLMLWFLPSHVQAGPANPYPIQLELNGIITPDLYFHGSSPQGSFLTDADGYTVVKDERISKYVYALRNATTGEIVSSGIVVGQGDPANASIPKMISPFSDQTERHLFEGSSFVSTENENAASTQRRLYVPSVLKNLVVLVRFSNHGSRTLPSASDFDIVFNSDKKNHPLFSPTGSVRDVFRINSYGKFTLESKIFGWVTLPQTEAYYADGISGFGGRRFIQLVHTAMDRLRDDYTVNFSDFDADKDGRVDLVTVIHSGYAAEIYGEDQYGTPSKDRIWSHRWRLSRADYWHGSGMIVDQYSTSPALFDVLGSKIGRIGVISHEIGHCLGIPDLYGTYEGNGIGSYDFMSNHWGFPPTYSLSQLYPPIMSPWSKMLVGWVDPILIQQSGTFTIEPSEFSQQIYRIDINSDGTEYLLIENRQPIGYDLFLPQGGLAIWHIDDMAMDVEGYPGQIGAWPFNGRHYKVALLQADGAYDLERKANFGDEHDLFHGSGVDYLGPSLDLLDGPFPNTDAYQKGFARQTGIRIRDISQSSMSMEFTVDLLEKLPTVFLGGNGASGTMFDVVARKDIILRMMYIHLNGEGPTAVEVWMRTGTHVSFENRPWLWQRRVVATVDGKGRGKRTLLDVGNIRLNAYTRYAFYFVTLEGKFRYTNGEATGREVTRNDDLVIYEGVGLTAPFQNIFQNRIWNGDLFYEIVSGGPSRRLSTTFEGGSGQNGVMFDILPHQDLKITGFDVHIFDVGPIGVEIFTKKGHVVGSENTCDNWTLIGRMDVEGQGMNVPTKILLESTEDMTMKADERRSFYISIINGTGLRYTPGNGTNNIVVSNDHLSIFEGIGVSSFCGRTFSNRIWNGALHYDVDI
jgi:M6 family metalloprotease-like protein